MDTSVKRFLCVFCTQALCAISGAAKSSWYSALQSETTRFTNLGAEQGLWHPVVYDVEQDAHGLIWIATQDGLHRYDGKNLTLYSYSPTDPHSISSNWVWDIHRDSQQRLWFASEAGIHLYLPELDGFSNFTRQTVSQVQGSIYRTIAEAPDGKLWFGSQDSGITVVTPDTLTFQTLDMDAASSESPASQKIRDIHFDSQGTAWIATVGGGIGRLSDEREGRLRFFTTDTTPGLPNNSVRSVLVDSEGRLWAGTDDNGLATFRFIDGQLHPTGTAIPNFTANVTVRDIHESRNGTIRLATNNGLYQWQAGAGRFSHFQHFRTRPNSLLSNNVNHVFEDRHGVIWVGTYEGVSRWNAALKPFTHINRTNLPALASDTISAFTSRDDGTLFVGTWGAGVSVISPTGEVSQLIKGAQSTAGGLRGNRVMSLHIDDEGKLWVGTLAGGLQRFDQELRLEKSWDHTLGADGFLSDNSVSSILPLSDGIVFAGTYGGGVNIISHDGEVTHLKAKPDSPAHLWHNRVTSLATTDERFIWIGTAGGGVARYDRETERFVHFNKTATTHGAILSDNVYSILLRDNDIWLATQDMGVVRLRPVKGTPDYQTEHYNRAGGLRSNYAYGLVDDGDGNVWVSHSRGLSSINANTGEQFNFHPTHGLQGLDFNIGAYHRSQNGLLYFGGANGFNIVDPASLPTNPAPPSMVLVDVLVHNESILSEVSKVDGRYAFPLEYQDRYLEFKFAALDYTAPALNRYQYKWLNTADEWQSLSNETSLNIAGLTDGRHSLAIRGSNSDGVWTQEPLLFEIHVSPPWYRSGWAFAAYVIAIVLVILYQRAVHRQILNAKHIKQKELQRLVTEKTQQINQQLSRIQQLSITDELTGVHNRRFLEHHLPGMIARVRRSQGKELLSFVTLDIDYFKKINDNYGHDAGDSILKQLVDTLQQTIRSADQIIRIGGEEFLLLSVIEDQDELSGLLERLRVTVANTNFTLPNEEPLHVTCSIGAAYSDFAKEHELSANAMIRLADRLMYKAKASGRNCWWMINEPVPQNNGYTVEWLIDNLEKAEDARVVSMASASKTGDVSQSARYRRG
ncbi:diguanylate cyclase [Alteromonas sp. ASW11-19]|uniref:diguanylate cyclase n=1 Tax=Alteromonas salexigens TaxID=2982530 RepID=A0ABT2VK39_9ALTE|nr:ligand-binding sensor domain-containing diguanylate cyclase [Alteromonas salexigens]MCU7553157.1 diguanylate cyclase [Alteromonas salexigens]